MRGELDEVALSSSFAQLVERHEALRTRFYEQDGQAMQRVEEAGGFDLHIIDISDVPAAEREARAQQIREQEARTPFDLEHGPLFRVMLVKLAAHAQAAHTGGVDTEIVQIALFRFRNGDGL